MCSFLLLFSICILNLLVLISVFDWGGDDEKKPVAFDDYGAARTVDGRFFNLQPHFCSHFDYLKF
ncbi:hypothetical protein Hanom_Chr04g00320261 [Helianthus anomalus]